MTRRIWVVLLVAILAVLGLGACGGDDEPTTTPTTLETEKAKEEEEIKKETKKLEVTAQDYRFEGVGTVVEGGLVEVTFVNEGEKAHEAAFLQIGEKSVDEALQALAPAFEGKPFPDAPKLAGGVSGVKGGETHKVTMLLPPGKYALICALTDEETEGEEGEAASTASTAAAGGEGTAAQASAPHFALGMKHEFEAEGEEGAHLHETGTEITARDYSFETAGLKAGKNEVVFTNEGEELHHFVLSVFKEGITEKDALDAFRKFAESEANQEPPPEGAPEPEDVADTIPIDKGFGQTVELSLEKNRTYLLTCFISDRAGGPPHAFAHNMVKTFTLT